MSYEMDRCPVYASFFGAMGCAFSMVFASFGASYAMAKSGVGVMAAGVLRPDQIMTNMVPPLLGSILSIYGLIVSVLIAGSLVEKLPLFTGFLQLGAGIAIGLSGLAAGFTIGIVGDAGVRGSAQQPRMFVGMVMILIFAEVLGLYGMVVALLMLQKGGDAGACQW